MVLVAFACSASRGSGGSIADAATRSSGWLDSRPMQFRLALYRCRRALSGGIGSGPAGTAVGGIGNGPAGTACGGMGNGPAGTAWGGIGNGPAGTAIDSSVLGGIGKGPAGTAWGGIGNGPAGTACGGIGNGPAGTAKAEHAKTTRTTATETLIACIKLLDIRTTLPGQLAP